MMKAILLLITILTAPILLLGTPVQPLDYRVPAKIPDAAQLLSPADIQLDGWLGERVLVNATNRLMTADLEPLLAGFRHKPGSHPWIGEHIGKWLHAATLAWAYTGDPALRKRMDYAVSELIRAQEPDGYLGTYVPEKRFGLYEDADWDVWSQKYCMVGLLTYYRYTGDQAALAACRKTGDLLIRTFGPGKKDILSAGTHVGMAATAVLGQMVLLYRYTGDERYLDFARYLVQSWDEPNGPKIIQTLLKEKQVNKVADAKAYEMLCNLVGLCEMARATGDRELLEPVLIAWQDIVKNLLYITGSASQWEAFHDDDYLPNQYEAHPCETCVSVTWMQLNLQLLRLTGEARYADQIEKTLYNHLTAAQNPRGDDWCYYTPLQGVKPYDDGIACCHSSGPRGMALAPQTAYLKAQVGDADALLVSTFETSTVTTELGGQSVKVMQRGGFPLRGKSLLTVKPIQPARFAMQVRVPPWAAPLQAKLNGKPIHLVLHDGWAVVPARQWSDGDSLELNYTLASRLEMGAHGNAGKAALTYGPFVLAYDQARNPGAPKAIAMGFKDTNVQVADSFEPGSYLKFSTALRTFSGQLVRAKLVPFADAGRDGAVYRIWLAAPEVPLAGIADLLIQGQESRSRHGNLAGSINAGDTSSFVVTFDNQKQDEDWYAVTLDKPVTIRRVVFVAGSIFHDGGWFDASAGKPRIQVQREAGGGWEPLAEIGDYPATTARDSASLRNPSRRTFTAWLAKPEKVAGVRVIGKPACGDNPQQAFSSCAELQAFAD
ncbi:MAG: beta-L-arabinofuranosidase domain-containing protein [Verrucomicrobiota bacterium]|jgi:DUF1680 family protein